MKKIILSLVAIILLSGCGSKNINLDLDKVNEDLANTNLFKSTESVDINYLEKKYGLDAEGVSEYSVYMSLKTMSSSMYAIFKITDDSVKEHIEKEFIQKYVDSWTINVYDAKEADLVNNMHSEKYGDYLIYIISEDNDKVLETIKG